MNKDIIKLDGKKYRYLSELPEFKNGLLHGVINKKTPDVGGTYTAANCNHNYIIVVPFKDLALSIENDKNNKYKIFKLYGGILKSSLIEYISTYNIKKIVVTYDSFEKLTDWLEEIKEDLSDYKILIDEYHLMLEDMDFRSEAIESLLNNVNRYKHYSFLSATPMNVKFEFGILKELPYYEIIWDNVIKIKPYKIKTPNVYKATSQLIKEFNDGLTLDTIDGDIETIKELHIFINTVKGISQICKTLNLNPKDVRIICSQNIRNTTVLNKYKINSIIDPVRPINFYTKKGFQGCNIFSNNALLVVVSDARLEHTLIDIETTMNQIVGRLRTNKEYKNIFRHKIYHIFSTNKNIMNDKEFEEFINVKRKESMIMYEDLNSKDPEVRKLYLDRINFESDFISRDGNNIYFNENKEQLFRYKHKLKNTYRDGISLKTEYDKNTKFKSSKQKYVNFDDIILSKITTVKLEDLYRDYLTTENKEMYLLEYPKFKEYEEYLTTKEMNTARWVEKRLDELILSKKLLNQVHKRVSNKLNVEFISNADLKQLYEDELISVGSVLKSKATLIKDNPFISSKNSNIKIDGKVIFGYTINKL